MYVTCSFDDVKHHEHHAKLIHFLEGSTVRTWLLTALIYPDSLHYICDAIYSYIYVQKVNKFDVRDRLLVTLLRACDESHLGLALAEWGKGRVELVMVRGEVAK